MVTKYKRVMGVGEKESESYALFPKGWRITDLQVGVLKHLFFEPMGPTELSKKLGTSKGSIRNCLKTLEKRQWVGKFGEGKNVKYYAIVVLLKKGNKKYNLCSARGHAAKIRVLIEKAKDIKDPVTKEVILDLLNYLGTFSFDELESYALHHEKDHLKKLMELKKD